MIFLLSVVEVKDYVNMKKNGRNSKICYRPNDRPTNAARCKVACPRQKKKTLSGTLKEEKMTWQRTETNNKRVC